MPDVPGLADGSDPDLLGLLISHPHLEHYGLADQVSARVPHFVSRAAAAIIEAGARRHQRLTEQPQRITVVHHRSGLDPASYLSGAEFAA